VTTTSASFVIPAIGATVTISVGDTSWLKTNKNIFINDGGNQGNFIITGIGNPTSLTGKFLGLVGDSAPGTTVASGAIVIPGLGNFTVPWDLDSLTAFTDNSGGTKSDTIAASLVKQTIILPIGLVGITGNGLQLALPVPFAFAVTSCLFRIAKVVTAGAKLATLTVQVNGSSVTGGVINLTSANCTPYGATVAGSAITGSNTGTAGQTVGFISSAVTPFTEGDGWLELTVTNLDFAATVAAIAFKANQLRTALRHQ
jgi:hypothetical protein